MGKRSRSSLGSTPITCWSVMHWALTPRGMPCPQGKKTTGTFRPLEHGLDGIEFYNFAGFSPELGAALLARRIDYGRLLDPVTLKKAQATPGMSGTDFYQSAIHMEQDPPVLP